MSEYTEIKREYRPDGSLAMVFAKVEIKGRMYQSESWYSTAGVLFNGMQYPADSAYAKKRLKGTMKS